MAALHDSPSPVKCERLGQIARLSTEFSQVLRNPRSNFTAFLSRSASVVAGTCVGVGKHALGIVDLAYDWVIVDEAARASPMELVVAMQAGKRVLLVGDHLQLPPIYPVADFVQHDGCRVRQTINFVRAHQVLKAFPDRQMRVRSRLPIRIQLVALQDAFLAGLTFHDPGMLHAFDRDASRGGDVVGGTVIAPL